ncbi:HlyD family type I secretion periplasmic adaptor subunit [Haliovirga abyssi]|uniref:HlyD family type I secretion periplasmic adaptor subunit n=1 Tax=Haliovirga abyssi TaxID=2996794 RepID=A0AAU9DN65_9FUSO|nr:HlyD family type I secretion periplasmic adaptor subunit [Haliovirga abyssi]BDU51507.1 HlyD family type I secretion periplasmic adaptor subunit [Haliovirga abyssi]
MLRNKKEKNAKYEFLSSALEIVESPPSPLGSLIIWIILLLLISVITWSYVSKTDEVATAMGKIVPGGKLKVIQSLEEGKIVDILVEEGAEVKEGQLLVKLNLKTKAANLEALNKSLLMVKLEMDILRKKQVRDIFKNNKDIEKVLSKSEINSQRNYYEAKEKEYLSKRDGLKTLIKQKDGEILVTKANLEKLLEKYRALKEKEENLKYLYEVGSIPRIDWINKKDEVLITEKDLKKEHATIDVIKSQLTETKDNLVNLDKSWDKGVKEKILELDKKKIELEANYIRAKESYKNRNLYSPVDGIINEIGVTTIGEVVTSAKPIITIVPKNTPLLAEVKILNKDIGFIKKGQGVDIKLDTFPFQKYGSIKGNIIYISSDIIEDKKLGAIYKAKIKLQKTTINVNGKAIKLLPGMNLSADIKIGKRRVIEFFLSPLMKVPESLKLR